MRPGELLLETRSRGDRNTGSGDRRPAVLSSWAATRRGARGLATDFEADVIGVGALTPVLRKPVVNDALGEVAGDPGVAEAFRDLHAAILSSTDSMRLSEP